MIAGGAAAAAGLAISRHALAADVESILSTLSIDEKIGQLLMVGVAGTEMIPETKALLSDLAPGGLILLGRNVREPTQLAALSAALQEGASIPRFLAIDQEGGTVVRVAHGATVFPGAMATGATGSTDLARLEGRISGTELAALGINMNLAPVLDVNSNRKNPVIGVRAYGDDPARVASLGTAYASGLQEAGVVAVAKHFPGHGDAIEDSHKDLPTLMHDLARLRSVELVPFGAASKAGIDAMMTAHLRFPKIDDVPATMSKVFLTDVLRGEIGFQGIVLTDDLEMKAIYDGIGVGPAAVKAIAAGADMLMVIWRRESKDVAKAALLAAVNDGRLPVARVDEAVRRTLSIKMRRGLFGERPPEDLEVVGNPHHLRIAKEIAEKAITVIANRDGALPATAQAAPKLVVLSSSDDFLAAMRSARPGSVEVHLPARPDAAAVTRILGTARRLAPQTDRFVISVSNEDQAALANALSAAFGAKRPVIGVALGAPYLLDSTPGVAAHVCAYGSRPDSIHASVRVVIGVEDATGHAPVKLSNAAASDTTKKG
jgi:beta-N-acetylhexosaminidase